MTKQAKPFEEMLAELDGGGVLETLTERLAEVVGAVREHGDKGEVSLKVKIEINKAGRLQFSPEVKAKRPDREGGRVINLRAFARGPGLAPTEYTLGPNGQYDLFDGPVDREGDQSKSRARERARGTGRLRPPACTSTEMPTERIEIEVSMTLRNELAAKLFAEAQRRKREPAELLAEVVERVIADDLVAAVIDE